MKIVIVRHGKAAEKNEFPGRDELRPLTAEGRDKMSENARGMRLICPSIDVLVASPLVRARQTAEIIANEYKIKKIEEAEELKPEADVELIFKVISRYPSAKVLAVVGHEPHVGDMSSWLLAGKNKTFFNFKKGAACCIDIFSPLKIPISSLDWFLEPTQLRSLK